MNSTEDYKTRNGFCFLLVIASKGTQRNSMLLVVTFLSREETSCHQPTAVGFDKINANDFPGVDIFLDVC